MNNDAKAREFRNNPVWSSIIPDEQWAIYSDAIRVTRRTGARFLLGGAFGLAAYTGRWRNTKDIDFFVLPSDKDRIVDALTKAGFEDFYPRLSYDRGWIYRAVREDVLVDAIWQTPNRRSEVDEEWFARSRKVILRDEKLEVLPAEELLVIKLYVIQRDRCDWPDLINLLYQTCDQLDWNHVLNRLECEWPLLAGLLHLFNWVAPARALQLPEQVRESFHLSRPSAEDLALPEEHRVRLLDSRPWFAAFRPTDQPMTL
jgi:hypothetical protein